MDNRRTLSIIAQSTSTHRPSRIVSNNNEQDLEINGLDDLTIDNLQRRRSSRVSLIISIFYTIKSFSVNFTSISS
jgi:hypothetical protein